MGITRNWGDTRACGSRVDRPNNSYEGEGYRTKACASRSTIIGLLLVCTTSNCGRPARTSFSTRSNTLVDAARQYSTGTPYRLSKILLTTSKVVREPYNTSRPSRFAAATRS